MYAKFTIHSEYGIEDLQMHLCNAGVGYYTVEENIFIHEDDISYVKEILIDWECKFEINDVEVEMGYHGKCRADYIAMIKGKAERDRRAAMTEEEKRIEEWNNLYYEVARLKERITEVLVLARECRRNNVKIPESRLSNHYDAAKKYGYDADFFAEGIRHHVGFDKNLEYLTINNGGACGPIDFYTNGDDITGEHESTHAAVQARAEDMRQFLKEFPVFEGAFYKWIESLNED